MEKKFSRMWRSGLSMLLVICMVLGMCPISAFAAPQNVDEFIAQRPDLAEGVALPTGDDDIVDYVSLGDSMSNGYGLDGYNGSNGPFDYGFGAYGNLFEKWLMGQAGEGIDVKHYPLGMSGMYAADLHFVLEFDYNDPNQLRVAQNGYNDEWKQVFEAGNSNTADIINGSRFAESRYFIELADNSSNVAPDSSVVKTYNETENEKTLIFITKYYQEAVKNADIITFGLGSGDLGVFMYYRLMDVFNENKPLEDLDIKAIFRCLDPEVRAYAEDLVDKLDITFDQFIQNYQDQLPEMFSDLIIARLKNLVMYCVANVMVNNVGTIQQIVTLNPDVDLILMPQLNTYGDTKLAFGEDENGQTVYLPFTMAEMLDVMMVPCNAFMAVLPAVMQASGNELYSDANLIYAEAENVEVLVDVYDEVVNNVATYKDGVVRERFIEYITATDGTFAIWGMIGGLLDTQLPGVKKAEIEEFEAAYDAAAAGDISLMLNQINTVPTNKLMALAMYLGFERAIVKSSTYNVMDLTCFPLLASGNFGEIFAPIASALQGKPSVVAMNVAASVLAYMVEVELENTVNNVDFVKNNEVTVDIAITSEQILNIVGGTDATATALASDAVNQIAAKLAGLYRASYIQTVAGMIQVNLFDGINSYVNSQIPGLDFGINVADYFASVNNDTKYSDEALLNTYMLDEKSVFEGFTKYIDAVATEKEVAEYVNGSAIVNGYLESMQELAAGAAKMNDMDAMKDGAQGELNGFVDGDAVAYVADLVGENVNANFGDLAALMNIPDGIPNALNEEKSGFLMGLLHMYGRHIIGNGIGAHPSTRGHQQVAETVIGCYVNNYSPLDKTIDVTVGLIKEYYDEIYAYAYRYAKGAGYIDKAAGYIDALIAELEAIDVSDSKMTDAFKAEVAEEIAKIIAVLNQAKDLIETAEKLDETAYNKLMSLLGTARDALEHVLDLLQQAGDDTLMLVIKPAYDKLVNEIIPALNDKLEAGVIAMLEKIDALLDELLALIQQDVNAALKDLYDDIVALKNLIAQMIQDKSIELLGNLADALKDVMLSAKAAGEYLGKEAMKAIDALITDIKVTAAELYESATHDEYDLNCVSSYVALGDGTTAGNSYAAILADELDVTYKNLANPNKGIAEAYGIIETNRETIENADLITLGYGNVKIFNDAVAYANARVQPQLGWLDYISEEALAELNKALTEVEAYLSGQDSMKGYAGLITDTLEAYAYYSMSYACELPEVINVIHEINPDAVIAIVGMYNPLENITLTMGGASMGEIGEYLDYVVTAANIHNFAYALVSDNAIFVEAADVETVLENENDTSMRIENLLFSGFDVADVNPSEAGYEYIAEQILNALTVSGSNEHIYGEPSEWTWTESETGFDVKVTFTCTVDGCDETYTVPADAIKVDTTDAECEEDGKIVYTATIVVLGQSYTDEKTVVLEAPGHTEEIIPGKEATCTETGLTEGKKCSVCSEILVEQEEIAKLAHTEEIIPGKEATCTETGLTEGKKCSVCGEILVEQEEIKVIEHSFKDGKCSVCGEKDPDYVAPTEPTEPKPTEPKPTEPKPTEPKPTEPKPTEPKPTEPKPTEPKPTEPKPTEPKPTEPEAPTVEGVGRVYGDNRYETAFAVSDMLKETLGVDKFNTVVVASGTKFADALAGSYLANAKGAPILITNKHNVTNVQEYIAKNLAKSGTIYILGGDAAVGEEFEAGLAKTYTVKRLEGENRYLTNLAILEESGIQGGTEILVATGRKYPDSLSASATGKPILLVRGDMKLFDYQVEFLKKLGTKNKFVIIGGDAAVSVAVAEELKQYGTIERLAGKNRYETTVLLAEHFFDSPKATVLASGKKFPDGLCGGPLAFALKVPLVLTYTGLEQDAVDYAKKNGIHDGYILGGDGLISDNTGKDIFKTDKVTVK